MKVTSLIIFLLCLGILSPAITHAGCLKDSLRLLWKISPKQEQLNKMYAELTQAYKKGGDLSNLRYEMMDLKKLPATDPDKLKKISEIETKYLAIKEEITVLNNSYINRMHDFYKADGMPSILVKGKDGALSLVLDFSAPATNQPAFEFYRKVKNRFGLDKVTLNLKDNVELGSAGFFSTDAKRIEMGPGQGFSLLEDYFNSVSKHESRHSMFFAKRTQGYDSIFHARFFASPDGNLLNADKVYDTFMSAEELYTFSTDFQSLGQVFKGEFVTDLAKRATLLDQISSHQDMFKKVASAHEKISLEMINSLDEIQKSTGKKQYIHMAQTKDGNWTLRIRDNLRREAEIVLVGPEEKALAKKFIELNNLADVKMNSGIEKKLKELGMNTGTIGVKAQQGKLTPEESALLNKTYQDYMVSPEALASSKELDISLAPIIQNAKKMMSDLNELAVIQVKEADELEKMLKLYADKKMGGKAEQLKALRDQMFKTAKNVKEGYKGFAIQP